MIAKKMVGTLLAVVLLPAFACESRQAFTGRAGEWIKGEGLSARITVRGTRIREPIVELLNDSGGEVAVVPVSVTAVYEGGNRRQVALHTDEGLPEKLAAGSEYKIDALSELSSTERLQKIQVDVGPPGSAQRFVVEGL